LEITRINIQRYGTAKYVLLLFGTERDSSLQGAIGCDDGSRNMLERLSDSRMTHYHQDRNTKGLRNQPLRDNGACCKPAVIDE
jgi:hypothetical protein